jgi:hypothetical protein
VAFLTEKSVRQVDYRGPFTVTCAVEHAKDIAVRLFGEKITAGPGRVAVSFPKCEIEDGGRKRNVQREKKDIVPIGDNISSR